MYLANTNYTKNVPGLKGEKKPINTALQHASKLTVRLIGKKIASM